MIRITNALVKTFESEQQRFGTKTALHNIFWLIGAGILKCAGVKVIKTS